MKINEDKAHLRVEISSGGQMTAQIEPKRKIDVLIGDAAKMDCQRAINYIKSGTAEIDKAVEDGIEKIEQKVEGMADVDLSNLSFLGRAKFDAKQDAISDLATIREGAALGATAVQPTDLAMVATTGDYDDLSGTPTLASVATSGSYNDLSNKPSIPAAQVNSDWNATSGVAQILNKPSLAAVATSGAYADLSGTPDLSAKADTDLSNVSASDMTTAMEGSNTPVIVETYKNGDNWYRVWSDGWCEQRIWCNVNGATNAWSYNIGNFQLLKQMKDTTYTVVLWSDLQHTNNGHAVTIGTKTTTDFKLNTYNCAVNGPAIIYGYIAEE